MIIELAPNISSIAIQQAQRHNMTTEDFITQLIKQSFVDEVPFNYDLERMKKAVEAPSIPVPHFATADELVDWLDHLTDDDFIKIVDLSPHPPFQLPNIDYLK